MKSLVALALLAVQLLVATPATTQSVNPAQNSPDQCPPPPAVVAAFLGFSEAQTEQFGTSLNRFQTTLRALQEQIAVQQQQLNILLGQPQADPAAVGKLVLQIHALQQQVAQAIQNYQSLFAGLLTPEQKQKIQEVTLASQLQPAVGAFVALYLVPPPPSLPCQKQ